MYAHAPNQARPRTVERARDANRERRLGLLISRLPHRLQDPVRWLLRPGARWVRLPAGVLLMVGGVLAILPILGLWMLPLGLVLLSEDIPPLRGATDRVLAWIEHNRPHWMGLPRRPVAYTHQGIRSAK